MTKIVIPLKIAATPRRPKKGELGAPIMKTIASTVLDPSRRSTDARDFETALHRKIVGQEAAVEKVVEIYQKFLAGLNDPNRPLGSLLFLGPTGSGKTQDVKALADYLFSN